MNKLCIKNIKFVLRIKKNVSLQSHQIAYLCGDLFLIPILPHCNTFKKGKKKKEGIFAFFFLKSNAS